MLRFLIVRASLLVVFVLAAASAMQLVVALAPGDPLSHLAEAGADPEVIARERAALGLDAPPLARYRRWLAGATRFDLGDSWRFSQPVLPLVAARAANTAVLAGSALLLAMLVGLPLGAIAGSGWSPRLSAVVSTGSLLVISVPPLITALLLALVAVRTGLLPTGGMSTPGLDAAPLLVRATDLARHLVVPALALALPIGAMLERVQAAAVAGGRRDRHVLAAAARGVPPGRLLRRALWRPTAAPVAAIVGVAAGSLLSGSLAVELVTAWPGMGRLTFEALGARDVPLAAGCAAAAAVFLAIWTTATDLVAGWLDPRVGGQS